MIKKDQLLSVLSYAAVGFFAVVLATWVSTSLLQRAFTQEPPPPIETPATSEPMAQEPIAPQSETPEMGTAQPSIDSPPPEDPALNDINAAQPETMPQTETTAPVAEKNELRTEVQSFLEPFIYDPKGRRDPFRPYAEITMSDSGGPLGPVMPLQKFALDQLRLIGIIWDVKEPKAMFLDPNSRIYTIGRDERIGPNNGYIAAIREGEVVVVESFRRREGDLIFTPRVLRIER